MNKVCISCYRNSLVYAVFYAMVTCLDINPLHAQIAIQMLQLYNVFFSFFYLFERRATHRIQLDRQKLQIRIGTQFALVYRFYDMKR